MFPRGEKHGNFKGGIETRKDGYRLLLRPNSGRSNKRGYILEHVFIAQQVLGKILPRKAVVHHFSKTRLVICENQGYHQLLHYRQRAHKASGHANWGKCVYCHKYDDPQLLMSWKSKRNATYYYHKKCNTNNHREKRARLKAINS